LLLEVDSEISLILVKLLVVNDGVNFLILIHTQAVILGFLGFLDWVWLHSKINFVYKCTKFIN
jgi:hypothetical protein